MGPQQSTDQESRDGCRERRSIRGCELHSGEAECDQFLLVSRRPAGRFEAGKENKSTAFA